MTEFEFLNRYEHKLKTREELRELVGPLPRERSVIMCHGVFDVVHPGHVRHLTFAKSSADILVVSITSDRHITKGVYRPHVPERLRALNLAAFEVVDYVLIDEEPKPLENLRYIQPDFFAKGFEYTSAGLPPATQEEADTVSSYGGQMVFTPGDVVYSSSALINTSLPKVQIEKLLLLMQLHDISFDKMRDTVRSLSGTRVHVVGDTIVDSYTRTTLIGANAKTPTFSVLKHGVDEYVGGAGIVARHLRTAGADVTFTTVLGEDALKDFVLDELGSTGVDLRAIVDPSRPTTNKNAIITSGYRLLKIDTVDNRPISGDVFEKVVGQIRETEVDIVVFCDFRHGIFNKATVEPLTKAIPDGVFKVADSQVASRWGNITEFFGFDLITPNEKEARFALADQDSTIGTLAGAVVKQSQCKTLMLKMGERGVFCINDGDSDWGTRAVWVDSFVNDLADAVGAGDALLAYATLTLKKTGSHALAAVIGSMAAACECECDGNEPIHPDDLLAKIDAVEKLTRYQS